MSRRHGVVDLVAVDHLQIVKSQSKEWKQDHTRAHRFHSPFLWAPRPAVNRITLANANLWSHPIFTVSVRISSLKVPWIVDDTMVNHAAFSFKVPARVKKGWTTKVLHECLKKKCSVKLHMVKVRRTYIYTSFSKKKHKTSFIWNNKYIVYEEGYDVTQRLLKSVKSRRKSS